jgi:hypothetical protein
VGLHGVLDHSHDGSSHDADPKEPYLMSMDMPWDSMVYLITAMMVLLAMRIRRTLPDVDGHAVGLHGVLDLRHDGPPCCLNAQGVRNLCRQHR